MKYLGRSLALFLTLFLVFSVENSIGELIPVKASYGSLGLTQAILPIGKEAGAFKESGLNVETVYIAGRSVSALIGGDVQFSMMGGPPAVLARLAGVDLVILGGKNTLGQILVSSPSIKDPKDLVGKRGGISRFGTLSEYSLRVALKKNGLEADRDVTIIQIGDTAARLGGL
ncbi:MAG: ABC transporter substrate-binding protein [Deltaproteobacteria bacterium]|nr:ABC transporter substrate-binding protein [Deltaproteobacteria bacterium]